MIDGYRLDRTGSVTFGECFRNSLYIQWGGQVMLVNWSTPSKVYSTEEVLLVTTYSCRFSGGHLLVSFGVVVAEQG
jgi:hypothetical protein